MQRWRIAAAAAACRARSLARSFSLSAASLTIEAVPREYTGSKVASKERAQGRVPAVVFEQNGGLPVSRKRLITTDRIQIASLVDSIREPFFFSRTFPLCIRAGPGSSHVVESGTVLPLKVHRKEKTGEILNLVLAWAMEGREMEVDVPIVFNGVEDCRGIKKGGTLQKIRTSLKYLCPVDKIPPQIDIDLSNLDVGDRIFMRDVDVDPCLKLLSRNDTMPICKIASAKL